MNDVLIASSADDAQVVEAVADHHAALVGAMSTRAERLVAAVEAREEAAAREARDDLLGWCGDELLPHARAEESTLYAAAARLPEGRLLVAAMVEEHEALSRLVERLANERHPVRVAAAARALQVLLEVHVEKEDEQVLPLLAGDPGVRLAELVDGLHDIVGGHGHHDHAAHGGCGCGGHQADESGGAAAGAAACGCGEVDGPGFPELDARGVPHAIRHATIFGALDAVTPGGGLVLVAPHDPLPLLAQLESRSPGLFAVSYLERGPEAWRLAFERRAA